jgi:hypothetical protein
MLRGAQHVEEQQPGACFTEPPAVAIALLVLAVAAATTATLAVATAGAAP